MAASGELSISASFHDFLGRTSQCEAERVWFWPCRQGVEGVQDLVWKGFKWGAVWVDARLKL